MSTLPRNAPSVLLQYCDGASLACAACLLCCRCISAENMVKRGGIMLAVNCLWSRVLAKLNGIVCDLPLMFGYGGYKAFV